MTQSEALDILKMGHNVLLTGAAGSGKTHTLNTYIEFLKESSVPVAITASTGIAATHLGGVTIHSWSGLGIRNALSSYEIDELERRPYLWKRYQAARVLIIDEISMLHHFQFDLVDALCRSFKRINAPFGGMQVILCGDFFQLPPISREIESKVNFVYHSKAWGEMDLKICYLSEQHRQNDKAFLGVLNDIRDNNVTEDTIERLQSRYNQDPTTNVFPTKLLSHNEDVDAINIRELTKISGAKKYYHMRSHGKKNLVESLTKSCLAPQELVLKVGAKVMFVKNNFEVGYANGTLGVVCGFDADDAPIVRIASDKRIVVEPASWGIFEDGKIKAEITQMPLRLAWAVTIHKSQGMSLDAAEIDLSKSFVEGMGYVALSRVRSLQGLKLLGINHMALAVREDVLKIDSLFKEHSDAAVRALGEFDAAEIKKMQEVFLKNNASEKKNVVGKESEDERVPAHHKTKHLLLDKVPFDKIVETRGLKATTIIGHIEKLVEDKENVNINYIKDAMFSSNHFEKIEQAFRDSFARHGDLRLAPVREALKRKFSYDELRLARVFIDLDN